MDLKEYIQSGIIESYVLGLTSAEETIEVENLRKQLPELNNLINEFSIAIEEKAFENSVDPPPYLKGKILAALQTEISSTKSDYNKSTGEGWLFSIPPGQLLWGWIAAASVLLLIGSAALNFYFYNKFSKTYDSYMALLSEKNTLQANNNIYQTQLKEWQTAASMIADPDMAMVKMRSIKGRTDAATVFWDTQKKDVFVMVNSLPEPAPGRQYQLWAIVDGKPVDAGVLDPSCSSVCKMKNIPKAEAFAITLEKEGGSTVPHLRALFVKGEI